ncbi:hypothetical protein K3495_g12172 [Podosphaera aphanis]|nr:hypothetical protein K3495_g12172 [Podosphaera aphanis]
MAAVAVAAGPLHSRQIANTFTAQSLLEENAQIDGRTINANNLKFFINKDSSAYCPEGVANLDCSKFGTATVIAFGNEYKTLGLATSVPGGQQALIDSDGALIYTMAHSGATPPGSILRGFDLPVDDKGAKTLTFQGRGFTACPTDTPDVFQVFATASPGFTRTDCVPFTFSMTDSPAVAFQY